MDVLKEFLTRAASTRLKIIVVGDSVIDEYYAVRVHRVSPEFPIPVLLSEYVEPVSIVPGGAANVCYQMKHWNVEAHLLTAVDAYEVFQHWVCHDHYYKNSVTMDCNFHSNNSVEVKDWKMPRKKRFYDGDFPLDRWDVEKKPATNTEAWNKARLKLIDNFYKTIREIEPHIVILSDYGKGVFIGDVSRKIIDQCKNRGIPVIVDPKTIKPDMWKGCSVLKPNSGWVKSYCDKYDLEGEWLKRIDEIGMTLNCDMVVTDSGNGVGIYKNTDGEQGFYSSPELSQKRPVIRSVIGAGDSFGALFAMAMALKFDIDDSVRIAFNGANVYIEDKHNSPITPYKFHKWFDPIGAKIVTLDQLLAIKKQNPNQTWVWTNGCFDGGLHIGHLKTFEEAKKLGDKVIVGINTDESVKTLKGTNRPIFTYKDRETMVANLQNVDFVVPIEESTPLSIIQKLIPNKLIKGGDYKARDVAGWNVVGEENVHLVPILSGYSTSNIIERIKNG